MKFQYLGTAAAEGVPALFCTCERCVRSREIGGRALRTRSQALIDDVLLIDFPADSLCHAFAYGLDYSKMAGCLVTHSHADHLYPADLEMFAPGFGRAPEGTGLHFYGTKGVIEAMTVQSSAKAIASGRVVLHTVGAYDEFEVGGYHITAYLARHAKGSDPIFYQIEKNGKNVLYAHDTHYFTDDIWEYWEKKKPHFDLVSLDCTNALLPLTYVGHMGLAENVEVRKKMLEMGIADENTKFICNHFSHNGTGCVYDDYVPVAAAEGFLVSYDGMKLEI